MKILLQPLNIPAAPQLTVTLARLDLLHPHYGGNKWFKLKYNLEAAKQKGCNTILTYGGAYSNHIYATAAACADAGMKSIGVIRGEETLPLNDTLQFATEKGMRHIYLPRSEYNNRSNIIQQLLKDEWQTIYEVPDGGSNALGIKGCMEITSSIQQDFDYIICACGTFTTLAGIAASLQPHQKAIGISVLKADGIGKQSLMEMNALAETELQLSLTKKLKQVTVLENYHFGGYAKSNKQLEEFMDSFYNTYHVKLDHVYTGKMLFAFFDLIQQNYFAANSRIMVVMSGRGSDNL